MKKVFTLIAALVLGMGMSVNAADPALTLSGGTGTKEDPYKISTKADVLELANACNDPAGGTNGSKAGHYLDKYFIITADIDMKLAEGETFLGIAQAPFDLASATTWKFQGHIDGQNHTIKNMVINGTVFDTNGKAQASGKNKSRNNVGFIGHLGKEGSIKNIIFDKTCSVDGLDYVGMAVGQVEKAAILSGNIIGAEVSGIQNYGTVTAYSGRVGGVVGYTQGSYSGTGANMKFARTKIHDCFNAGEINAGYMYAGGIIGNGEYVEGDNLLNIGTVNCTVINAYHDKASSMTYAGGIAGICLYGEITNVQNLGPVYCNGKYAGGLYGQNYSYTSSTANRLSNTTGAVSTGQVSNTDALTLGAIAGYSKPDEASKAIFKDVYYDGQMADVGATDGKDVETIKALPTATLTDGTLPAGLSAEKWVAVNGQYPCLKAFAEIPAVKDFLKTYILFPEGSTNRNFLTKATASAGSKLSDPTEGYKVNAAGTELSVIENLEKIITGSVKITNGQASFKVDLRSVPALFEGEGTQEKPYLIKTKKDVLNMAEFTTNPSLYEHFAGKYFKQTADIDMKLADGEEFIGIAVGNNKANYNNKLMYFSGVYDGDNHVIKNLKISAIALDAKGLVATIANGSSEYVGFFGTLRDGGVVKNLHFDSTCEIEGRQYVGSVAGYMAENSEIINCTSAATVTTYEGYGGGMAGYIDCKTSEEGVPSSKIDNCVFFGKVLANNYANGGIAGYSKGLVNNCANYGTITVGALPKGTHPATYTSLKNAGGIVGINSYGQVYGTVNGGEITALSESGGIVGKNSFTKSTVKSGTIQGAINYGVVNTTTATTTGAIVGTGDFKDSNGKALFSATYFDKQLSAYEGFGNQPEVEGVNGLETKAFTEATELVGIPTASLEWKAGFYPYPKAVASEAIVKTSAGAYLLLGSGVKINDFSGEATVSKAETYTVKLGAENKGLKLEGEKISALKVDEITENSVSLTKGEFTRTFPFMLIPSVLPGAGTQADPYIIASADDFNHVGDYIAQSGKNFAGQYFSITKDLDFTGKALVPAGSKEVPFCGIVAGNKHVIKNLNIEAPAQTADRRTYMALFAVLGEGSKVADLTFDNCKLTGYGYTAFVAGETHSDIENITINANCELHSLYGSSSLNGERAGAITGMAYPGVKIANCKNGASVEGMKYIGGIVGYAGKSGDESVVIENCENSGKIVSNAKKTQSGPSGYVYPSAEIGGIAGQIAGRIENCRNSGEIVSSLLEANDLGGITGCIYTAKAPEAAQAEGDAPQYVSAIINCENTGDINAYGISAGIAATSSSSSSCLTPILISKCINKGKVNTKYSYAAGIVSKGTTNIIVSECGNLGAIKSESYNLGGIMAETNGKDVVVEKCYNAAPVEGTGFNSGILGNSTKEGAVVRECFNAGNVTVLLSSSNWIGASGISLMQVNISDCYNVADVKGNYSVAGIMGRIGKEFNNQIWKVSNVYSTGKASLNEGVKDENKDKYGHILGDAGSEGYAAEVTNGFYTGTVYPMDKAYAGKGVQHLEDAELMTTKKLGENFVINPNCFPMLKNVQNDVARINAIRYTLSDGDFEDDVTGPIQLGKLEGSSWTGEGFDISYDTAYPSKIGPASLTVKIGEYTRTFKFEISETSGIENINPDNQEGDAVYYDLQGVKVINPVAGQVYIKVVDGKATKVVK